MLAARILALFALLPLFAACQVFENDPETSSTAGLTRMQGELTAIMNGAKADYKEIADQTIATLTWVRYRIEFRQAFYKMADEIKQGE